MSTAQSLFPPLREGDRLTREEFIGRWDATADVSKAELIDGIVYTPSPLGPAHGSADALMLLWAGTYAAATPGCQALSNASWSMSRTSLPQPDSALRILPEYGGNTRDETSYVVGIPELVIEICQSSAAYDFGPKLRVYETTAVPEYITMSLSDVQIVWRELLDGRYQPLAPDCGGVIHSRIFPGLWLNTEAALAGNVHRLLDALRRGLESEEHADFVRKLATRKR